MIARAARRRVRAGGPLTRTRPALSLQHWHALVIGLRELVGGRCEVCRTRPGTDPHHVRKRSQGGEDSLENIVLVCRACHDRTDAPYAVSRLVFAKAAAGGWVWHVLRGPDKWTAAPTGESGEIAR